jgi:hypothetical protein
MTLAENSTCYLTKAQGPRTLKSARFTAPLTVFYPYCSQCVSDILDAGIVFRALSLNSKAICLG